MSFWFNLEVQKEKLHNLLSHEEKNVLSKYS